MEIKIDSDAIFEALPILLGAIIGIWIICAIIIKVKNQENESLPVQHQHAVVVEKVQPPPNAVTFSLSTTFQLDSGERLRFVVPVKDNLVVGDQGMLTWQGTAFRSFVRDGHAQ